MPRRDWTDSDGIVRKALADDSRRHARAQQDQLLSTCPTITYTVDVCKYGDKEVNNTQVERQVYK